MRIPWSYNSVVSITRTVKPGWSFHKDWRHTDQLSAHLVKVRYGNFRVVRLRHTKNHAKRLGLPVI
jgi:hypothetical protein